MDADRFDFLARSLGASSRRGFSRALAGLGLAGGLSSFSSHHPVEAKRRRRKHKKKCKGETKRCEKRCIPETDCCTDDDCDVSLGLICVDGECICGTRRGLSIEAC